MIQSKSDGALPDSQSGDAAANSTSIREQENDTTPAALGETYMLLFDEHEAVEYGLNEAIILNQMRYWQKAFEKNGQPDRWIYNTYQDWQYQFPFMSDSTVRRAIKKLEKLELIHAKLADTPTGKTCKHYRVCKMTAEGGQFEQGGQNEQGVLVKMTSGGGQNDQLIYKEHKTTHKTTTETIPCLSAEQIQLKPLAAQIQEVINSAVHGKPPKNDPEETCVVLEKLVRLDGIPESELLPLAHWIAGDDFWRINAPSVLRWRDRKGKDKPHKAMQCYVRMLAERAGPPSRQARALPHPSEYRDL